MTESEKALSQFIAFANKHAPNKVDEITSAISEMKKLVDRDVPKEVVLENEWHSCPSCEFEFDGYHEKYNKYCGYCGQAIKGDES